MKIGLFTDTHYCQAETLEQNRHPYRAYDTVKEAYDAFKKEGTDVVICLGDMIHFHNGKQSSLEHLDRLSNLIKSYDIPTYLCMGNHDNEVVGAEEMTKLTGFATAPYVVEDEKTKLILLDASYTPDGKPYGREHIDWTVSFVPDEQLKWLKENLNTDKKCVVFIHQNIDTDVEEHHIVSNAEQINSLLAKYKNITHVYQGHYHLGNENIINSIPYTTLRSMCIGEENNYKIVEE